MVPGFHMLPSLRLLRKKNLSDRSDHSNDMETTLQRSQRQWSLRYKKFYLSDRWRVLSIWSPNFFFWVTTAITVIVAIIWKPGLIYRNNHPPFLLNCSMYALLTYRRHSPKLRLLLVCIDGLWKYWWGADTLTLTSRTTIFTEVCKKLQSHVENGEETLLMPASQAVLSHDNQLLLTIFRSCTRKGFSLAAQWKKSFCQTNKQCHFYPDMRYEVCIPSWHYLMFFLL